MVKNLEIGNSSIQNFFFGVPVDLSGVEGGELAVAVDAAAGREGEGAAAEGGGGRAGALAVPHVARRVRLPDGALVQPKVLVVDAEAFWRGNKGGRMGVGTGGREGICVTMQRCIVHLLSL